jgi:hypothetical protein
MPAVGAQCAPYKNYNNLAPKAHGRLFGIGAWEREVNYPSSPACRESGWGWGGLLNNVTLFMKNGTKPGFFSPLKAPDFAPRSCQGLPWARGDAPVAVASPGAGKPPGRRFPEFAKRQGIW